MFCIMSNKVHKIDKHDTSISTFSKFVAICDIGNVSKEQRIESSRSRCD